MGKTDDPGKTELEQALLAEASVKNSTKRWGTVFLLALLLVAGFFGYQQFIRPKAAAVAYQTMAAVRGDLTITVTATGNLQPTNKVDIGTEISGTVKDVAADYNDIVKAGQILARLDTNMLEAQVSQSSAAVTAAKANLLQAQASVLEAESEMARLKQVRTLSSGKIPSLQDFDTALAGLKRVKANEAMIKASIAQAQAKLRIDQTNLEKAIIVSPIDGVVLSRDVEKGQTVAASLQAPILFTLAEDLTKMELQVNVDEADVGMVEDGQHATFTVDAYPDQTFPATIKQVRYGAQDTESVVTYLTVLEVDNSDLLLRPGMTATADIVVKELRDALLVPNAALRFAPQVQKEKKERQGGSLLSRLFPRPRHDEPTGKPAETSSRQKIVWTLRDNQPVPISVILGTSSGIMTEVTGGDLTAGMPLIVESRSR